MCVHTKSEAIFSRDRIPWKINVQTRVAAIDAIFFQAARLGRLGRRDVGDALTAAQFSKYFNFEAVISQLGPISSRVTPRIIAVESEQDG